MFEDACVSGRGKLEATVFTRNREPEHPDAPELFQQLLADGFFFVHPRRVDETAALHSVELGCQSPNYSGFVGTVAVERLGVGKQQLIVHNAGEYATRERWRYLGQVFWSSRRSHRQCMK